MKILRTYSVILTETYTGTVNVRASNNKEAMDIVSKMIDDGDISTKDVIHDITVNYAYVTGED